MRAVCVCFFLCLAAAAFGEDGGSVVKNGGFEQGLDGWLGKREGVAIAQDFRYSDAAGLRLLGNPTGRVGQVQYLPAMKPNTAYRVRYAVKTKDIVPNKEMPEYKWGTCGAYVNVWAGKGKNLWFPARSLEGTMRWTVLGFDFESGEKADVTFYIRIEVRGTTGTAWFDDVVIEEAR